MTLKGDLRGENLYMFTGTVVTQPYVCEKIRTKEKHAKISVCNTGEI